MRLTEKIVKVKNTDPLNNPKGFVLTETEYISDDTKCMKNKYITKLGQLEDIEDKLGIDLVTLFKALKNGIYEKIQPNKKNRNPEPRFWSYEDLSLGYQFYSNEYEAIANDWTIYEGYDFVLIVSGESLRLKDYGKTWALTKEELE